MFYCIILYFVRSEFIKINIIFLQFEYVFIAFLPLDERIIYFLLIYSDLVHTQPGSDPLATAKDWMMLVSFGKKQI